MKETIAFSAVAHAVLFFSSALLAWLLPRYIEPFPSTRVEIISETELQQRLKTYRAIAKTAPREVEQKQQEQQTEEQPQKQKEEQSVAVESTATESSSPSLKTQEQTLPKANKAKEKQDETQEETIDSLLTSLEKTSEEEATLDESLDDALDDALAEPEAKPSFLTSESVLTPGELTEFRRHITRCWSPPVGAPSLENLVVDLLLTLDEQAYVVDALVIDRSRMTNDPFFRSAAEAALRTLSEEACSPLRLPLEKHALWKKTILRFDPRSLFGG